MFYLFSHYQHCIHYIFSRKICTKICSYTFTNPFTPQAIFSNRSYNRPLKPPLPMPNYHHNCFKRFDQNNYYLNFYECYAFKMVKTMKILQYTQLTTCVRSSRGWWGIYDINCPKRVFFVQYFSVFIFFLINFQAIKYYRTLRHNVTSDLNADLAFFT